MNEGLTKRVQLFILVHCMPKKESVVTQPFRTKNCPNCAPIEICDLHSSEGIQATVSSITIWDVEITTAQISYCYSLSNSLAFSLDWITSLHIKPRLTARDPWNFYGPTVIRVPEHYSSSPVDLSLEYVAHKSQLLPTCNPYLLVLSFPTFYCDVEKEERRE